MTRRLLWLFLILVGSTTILGGGRKRASASEIQLARAYGYSEREIEKLKAGSVAPPGGCSDPKNADFFSRFRRFHEIETFLKEQLCEWRKGMGSLGPSCEVVTIGHSVQGRPIYAVEIRNPEELKKAKKKGKKEKMALVVGTVHAREWTGTTSVLLSALRTDITDVSVTFIPVLNPDGYEYTWSGEKNVKKSWSKGAIQETEVQARYWRKNRRLNSDGTYGVDLNRNFGSSSEIWGTDKKSKSINLTESDIFQGEHGFSEPETDALNQYYLKHKKKIVSFFDVHCCIGAVLEPFSKSGEIPDYVYDTGQTVIAAINKKSPEKYEWKPRPPQSASGSGISGSWAFQEAKIPFTYIVEIRGKFVMKCSDIKNIGAEVVLGLEKLLKQLSTMEELVAEYAARGSESKRLKGGGHVEVLESSGSITISERRQTTPFFIAACLVGVFVYVAKLKREPSKNL